MSLHPITSAVFPTKLYRYFKRGNHVKNTVGARAKYKNGKIFLKKTCLK